MKIIEDAIKKLKPDKVKELLPILDVKRANEKVVISKILSISGLDLILESLEYNELTMLNLVYNGNDGITFGQIEKNSELNIKEIEAIVSTLSGKLLIYRIKNRQLLTNKMDKVYGIKEISKILNFYDKQEIKDHLKKVKSELESGKGNSDLLKKVKIENSLELLKYITKSGGIVAFEKARDIIPKNSFNKTISSLVDSNLIKIIHNLNSDNFSYILINEKIAAAVASSLCTETVKAKDKLSVFNRYYLVLNLLNAYDIISTFGLFLTKQQKFRKIDKTRIADSMYTLLNASGEALTPEQVSGLSKFLLSMLDCLKLDNDIARISLHSIIEEIRSPEKILIKIINKMDEPLKGKDEFPPPFEMPSTDLIKTVLKNISLMNKKAYTYIKTAILTELISSTTDSSIEEVVDNIESKKLEIDQTINFLCLTGIIHIKNSNITLSDIGETVTLMLLGIKISESNNKTKKSIYINPDFTLLIPEQELPSEALYHLLTHTQLIKRDLILHAVISKASIVNAHKRGLPLHTFIDTLKKYSKNEISQNLDFLLNEWSNQTVKLKIENVIILKSSHSTFIEEILHSKIKSGAVRQISSEYAIIERENLDEVIKLAQKNDAIITIFDEDKSI